MTMPTLLRRLWAFLRRDRLAADLEEEMRLHMELRAAELERQGMSPMEARHAARRRFGNAGVIEERSTDMWGFVSLDRLKQDLRFALRRVRQNPGFSVPVIVVLALGIGATTAVFSAVDAAFFRPLPFARPHELVSLTDINIPFDEEIGEEDHTSINIEDVQQMPQLFARSAAFASGGLNLVDPDNPVRVNAGIVTANFFSTLGVHPFKGRAFTDEEGKPRGPKATVISHALWQRQYGGGDILGKSIVLHGKSYQVVGIMPPGFSFPKESELWIPMSVPTTFETFEPFRGWLPSHVIARTAPGVTTATASTQLRARWEQRLTNADSVSRSYAINRLKDGAAVPLQTNLTGDQQRPLAVLMGATVLLLLIVCANVANLMLSDATRRQREVAVRKVLGATRGRIVRQLLAESVILSVAGALIGIAFAPAALSLLRAMMPTSLAGMVSAQLDLRVLVFATILGVATGIAFGLWPAIGAARTSASNTIKSGGGHGATARAGHARKVLVASELALTVMLLVGAGLMIRSFERIMSQDFGMNPKRVATLELSFAQSAQSRAERLRIINGAIERLRLRDGIEAAGAVNDLPLRGGGGLHIAVGVPGAPPPKDGEMRFARYLMASGGYFRAMGIDLLRGRTFTPADDSLAPRVAIISNAMAKVYWPGTDPIGRTITFTFGRDTVPLSVVGVVADVREGRVDRDPGSQMYLPIDAQTPSYVAIVARSALPPATLLAELMEAVRTADPRQAVFNLRMMEDVVDRAVAPRKANTLLITTFAGLALLLAALGVYAVVAYGVAQRSREFGIRSALGATASDLLGLVSREMIVVALTGVVAGLAGAWALSRIIESQLYGVNMHDPFTFATVPLVLLVPAAIAILVPAMRAMRVDPTEVMRAE